jgi:hypothetical protein
MEVDREEKLRRMVFEEVMSIICDTKIFADDEVFDKLRSVINNGDQSEIMKLYEAVATGE